MSRYKIHKTTNSYLKQVRKHKKPYYHKILGKKIIIYLSVMSPKYDLSSEFYIKHIPSQKGKDVLEVGCGSGVLSLFAYSKGARKVTAVDINKNALKNTKENFKIHNFKGNVYYSDVFSNVKGKFNTIMFNAPYHGTKPKNILEYGVSDPNYCALKIFMNKAKNYLKNKGNILLGFSNTGDIKLLNELIIKNKFFVKQRFEETRKGWTAYLYVLKPIIFKSKTHEWIYEDDLFLFNKYKKYISEGKVLKVGAGLGYATNLIKLYNKDIITLDTTIQAGILSKKDITKYGGFQIPFKGKTFDSSIITYTLHHMKNPISYIGELVRVTKKNIIIVEETYSGFLSKLYLIFNDWKINLFAKQKVEIFPKSYFRKGELKKILAEWGFNPTFQKTEKKNLFYKEILVFEKK